MMKTSFLLLLAIATIISIGLFLDTTHAEDCHYVTRYAPCIESKYFDRINTDSIPSGVDPKFTLAELSWKEASFPIKNGTGFVTAILKDPDLNNDANYKETANVFVYSDSDPELHVIELQETEPDSGIFERKFGISNSRSAPNVIFAQDGDTMGVMYVDFTMPPGYFSSDSSLISTTLIGSTGPPLERAPASHARVVDSFGNSIDAISVGEQVQITSDIANGQNREQKFAYLVMIQDDAGIGVSLAWIDGTLNPMSSFSPAASWIPQKEGNYVATMFVWESVFNPTALSPPTQIEFTVVSEHAKKEMQSESGNYQETFMFIIPQTEFKQFTDIDLRTLYYYKVNDQELSSLPRLSLLVDMTEDFSYLPISRLALRISDTQIEQYDLFFEQKCKEQRPFATGDDCIHADFSFEYDENWYYVYPKLAPHRGALEDSSGNWDPEYFTRQ